MIFLDISYSGMSFCRLVPFYFLFLVFWHADLSNKFIIIKKKIILSNNVVQKLSTWAQKIMDLRNAVL